MSGRVFVTGDTHGDDVLKLHLLADNIPDLSRDDYVIITGDFGGIWNEERDEEYLKLYTDMPFTVLFVDGNHENFDLLNSYPVTAWHGGKVHIIKDNIIHLMRGQIYDICGKSFFTFGGATSVDKAWRTEGVSWWPQESPTDDELSEGLKNLRARGNQVDYIITHSCGLRALNYPPLLNRTFQSGVYPENHKLAYIEDIAEFKHWYFGHYHVDKRLSDKFTVLYEQVVQII